MKNILKFLLIFALATTAGSCSDDNTDSPPTGDITLGQIDFQTGYQGGQYSTSVSVSNGGTWSAYSKISWIEVKSDNNNGQLTFTVRENDEIQDRTGYITVLSSFGDDTLITVTQSGIGYVHDRSSLDRMGLRGPIKTLSYYPDFLISYGKKNPTELHDLEFSENGQLTAFKIEIISDEVIEIRADLEYDTRNRLKKADFTTTGSVILESGTVVPWAFSYEFGYQNHGKYLATRAFTDIWQNNYGAYGHYDLWMPRMIKDLNYVRIINSLFEGTNYLDYVFTVSDSSASATLEIINPSETISAPDYLVYQFREDFTQFMKLPYSAFDSTLPAERELVVNSSNGNILYEATEFEEYIGIFERITYNDNLYNTKRHYFDDLLFGYDAEYIYDENGDLIRVVNAHPVTAFELNYSYDKHDDYGNWTAVSGTANLTRTITYYE